MIGIIDIVSKQQIEPDDVLFAYCSGPGSQGEKANYVITYTGDVYRVSIFEYGVDEYMERVCPFLRDWDYAFTFKRNDWFRLGLWGAHSLYIHSSMAADFANATKDFSSSDMYNKWLEVAVGLVSKHNNSRDYRL